MNEAIAFGGEGGGEHEGGGAVRQGRRLLAGPIHIPEDPVFAPNRVIRTTYVDSHRQP